MSNKRKLFDTEQDAFHALQTARTQAVKEKKNILVEVGADWCVWCNRLESYITTHTELYLLRSQYYVHVRVYSGDGEKLTEICRYLPPFDGIPHYFVFSPEGQLLKSQDTSSLEEGDSYNYEALWGFLSMWGRASGQGLIH